MKTPKSSYQFQKGMIPWNKSKLSPITCKKCEKIFLVRPSRLNAIYCSITCHNQCLAFKKIGSHLSEETRKKIGDANRGERYEKKCFVCAKTYFAYPYRDTKFCSRNCYWQSHTRTGKNGANWRGGTTKISQAIRTSIPYLTWRTEVFERDNYTCQACGAKNGNGKKITFNADHIEALSVLLRKHNIDSVQSALICADLWNINNGRTLCVECHRKTDTYGANILPQLALISNKH